MLIIPIFLIPFLILQVEGDLSSPQNSTGDTKGIMSIRERESKAHSIAELTCIKAYKEDMQSTSEAIIISKAGEAGQDWCEPIDETPTPGKNTTYLVLIRMRLNYTGPVPARTNATEPPYDRRVYFYVIASRNMENDKTTPLAMDVLAIIPRIPCIAPHKESVPNIQTYVPGEYFTVAGGPKGARLAGCHHKYRQKTPFHIYVSHMIFTGGHSNHLFLYGSRLIQSTDGGKSFVFLYLSFPHKDSEKNSAIQSQGDDQDAYDAAGKPIAEIIVHEIEVMTFDNEGHYAFLTNQGELWLGSTGDVQQIRLRPSEGYSMVQAMPSMDAELEDFDDDNRTTIEPFSIIYDEQDVLYEVILIFNETSQEFKTRRIPVDFILRFQKLYDELDTQTRNWIGYPPGSDKSDLFYKNPAKWSLYCPTSTTKFYENYVEGVTVLDPDNEKEEDDELKEVLPKFYPNGTEIKSRIDTRRLNSDNDHPAKWAMNIAIENVRWAIVAKLASSEHGMSSYNPDQFDRWVLGKQGSAKASHLNFVNKDKLEAKSTGNRLLGNYYLDYGQVLRLEIIFAIKTSSVVGHRDFQTQSEDKVQLNVDNPNGTLLQVDTEKIPLTSKASVKFVLLISVFRSDTLTQNVPGQNLLSFHLLFHLIDGFGTCAKRLADPFTTDTLSTVLHIGCRPSTELKFNWNQTLYSIRFKDRDAHYGRGKECYDNEFVCFFARAAFVLYFDIFDHIKQSYVAYTGNYVMRIVAGGYTKNEMVTYTHEQQEGYNVPGVSDVSLIWNEWDLKASKKIERSDPHFHGENEMDTTKINRERVLKSGVSAIQWACHTLSPCARIVPNSGFQTIFWFRILISNRGIENNTLCAYEKEFDLMLYGFPPSPETQLFTTIIFCLCILGILYLLFICLRSHKKVWRAARLKMSGWYLIVRDTFPKALKTHEEQNPDELLTQQQKDNIILSLQGHLKIPPLVPRSSVVPATTTGTAAATTTGGGGQKRRETQDSILTRGSSQMSLGSNTSFASDTDKNEDQSTWTDMVYEQIVSKRLAAIVDKNKKMRANILRRTSLHDTSIEQEKRYEKEHKKTIAEESLFTGKQEEKK